MEKLKTSSIQNGSTDEASLQIYCKNWFSNWIYADIERLNSLHTLFNINKYLDHMLVKNEQNYTKFWGFHKNRVAIDTILEYASVTKNNSLMLNY